jgi:hypothetical protein
MASRLYVPFARPCIATGAAKAGGAGKIRSRIVSINEADFVPWAG